MEIYGSVAGRTGRAALVEEHRSSIVTLAWARLEPQATLTGEQVVAELGLPPHDADGSPR